MTRIRLTLVLVLALSGLVASAAAAQACTKTWGSGSGNWSEAKAWSPEGVPTNTDDVCITAPGTYTVTLPAEGGEAKSLTLGSSSGTQTIDVVGASFIYKGETQHVTQLFVESATINSTGKIVLDATAGGTHTGGEEGGAGAYLTADTVENYGQIETQVEDSKMADYFKVSNLTTQSTGSVQVISGALNEQQEGEGAYPWAATNDGSITVDPGASWLMVTSFAGTASFTNDGSVVNNGAITMSGASGTATWTQSGGSLSGNEVAIQNGAKLQDSAGSGHFLLNHESARVTGTIPAGQTVTVRGEPFSSGGETTNNTGLLLGAGQLVNEGTLELVASGSGEASGGSVSVEEGSIQNKGKILAQVESPSRNIQLEVPLANTPAGTLSVTGGSFEQARPTATTNEGNVTVGPGAQYLLEEGGSFVNESNGTISPEIASASSVGTVQLSSPCCEGSGVFTAGGILAPILVGGFVPAAGQEFKPFLIGGKFNGTFATVSNGFTADYAGESSESPFVALSTTPCPPAPDHRGQSPNRSSSSSRSLASAASSRPSCPAPAVAHRVAPSP